MHSSMKLKQPGALLYFKHYSGNGEQQNRFCVDVALLFFALSE